MEIFHLYLRPTVEGRTFEITDDRRWPSYDNITVDIDQLTSRDHRPLKSLIQQLHDRTSARIMRVPDQTPVAEAIGETLFSSLIGASPKISASFDTYHDLCNSEYRKIRLALHLPASLHYLPWELLRDPRDPPGNFFSLNGSIIRYDTAILEKDFEPVEVPFRLWFIFANPSNRPYSGDTDLFPPPQSDIIFEQITPATFDHFQDTIRTSSYQPRKPQVRGKPQVRPLVFAFFGHGDVDDHKIGQLVFVKRGERRGITRPWVSDPRPGYAINDTIVTCPHLRVAFLCACESAWAETAIAFENSIAGNLLRGSASLGYIIGAQTAIDRFAADVFLEMILRRLPTTPLDIAISDARAAVRGMSSSEPDQQYSALDWWVPVLYSRAGGFDLIARDDIRSAVQTPPPVPEREVLGLDATSGELISPAAGLDATSGEVISPAAMISEVARRLTALLAGRRSSDDRERRVLQ
jgi:hypothetical protein